MSNDKWIETSIEMPKEGATCLVTTQGDIALAKYSEGHFNLYCDEKLFLNNVTAWKYADEPYEDETDKFKKAVSHHLQMRTLAL